MTDLYSFLKIIHLLAVISFMAGALYLPRLFVYHSMEESNETKTSKTFEIMERKLLKFIMNPAMIISLISGLLLSHYYLSSGFKGNFWIIGKMIIFFFGFGSFHMYCSIYRKKFLISTKFKTTKFFRFFNEIPTIFLILIIILVIIKPF
jgi:putative membrane protein